MNDKKEVSKHVGLLYSILNLWRIGAMWAKVGLIDTRLVQQEQKQYLMTAIRNINSFHNFMFMGVTAADKAIWDREFTDRDVEVLGSIFHELSQMDDNQRAVVEQVCIAIGKGEFKAELA
jgi:hypothetical protein